MKDNDGSDEILQKIHNGHTIVSTGELRAGLYWSMTYFFSDGTSVTMRSSVDRDKCCIMQDPDYIF
jgi:hypothetical protein